MSTVAGVAGDETFAAGCAEVLSASLFPAYDGTRLGGYSAGLEGASGAASSSLPWDPQGVGNAQGVDLDDAFGDLFRQGIHLTPQRIDLGIIAGPVQNTVLVWNATGSDQALAAVALVAGDGVSAAASGGQGDPPVTMPSEAEWPYVVTVSMVGGSILDGVMRWDFGALDADLPVTATRAVVLSHRHDWSDPIIERLSWLTDVLRAYGGREQRIRHREHPRREWEYRLLLEGREAALAENRLFAWQGQRFLVPLWRDWQPLASGVSAGATEIPCATDNLGFLAGELALLWTSPTSYEAATISTVLADRITLAAALQATWPAGTRLAPTRSCRVLQRVAMKRITSSVAQTTIELSEAPGVALGDLDVSDITLQSYLGFPVYLEVPERSEIAEDGYERELGILDPSTGGRYVDARTGAPLLTRNFSWLVQGRAAVATLRALFGVFTGRLNPVWLPTWNFDLELAATAGSTDVNLVVHAVGHALHIGTNPLRRDLFIQLKDGTVFLRGITASVQSGATDTLTVNAALGREVAPSDVERISFLELRRLDQDQVEFAWLTGDTVRCAVRTVGVWDEVTR